MNTKEPKSDLHNINSPFSDKSENGSFFSSATQTKKRFFSPNTIQPKLEVGPPDDEYEKEADEVADKVMRMPEPKVQRKCKQCEEEGKLQKKSIGNAGGGKNYAGSEISNQLASSPGQGSRIPKDVQSEMEQKIGADFSGVNIHTGSDSHDLNRQLGARAFTHGRDIYFNRGEYNPTSHRGKHLLAHELTHVVQQHGKRTLLQRNPEPATQADFHILNDAKDAYDHAMERYRNWLTNNLSKFLADVLISGKTSALETLHQGFGLSLAKTIVGDTFAIGSTYWASSIGGRQLVRLFFELRDASIVGGFIGFIASAIIETVISNLFDRTNDIISKTADNISRLVTEVINPTVNQKKRRVNMMFRLLRQQMRQQDETSAQWHEIQTALLDIKNRANGILLDKNDESLYRQLSLMSGVYSGNEVKAESQLPIHINSKKTPFRFIMQQRVVETERTHIVVPNDNSKIIINSRGEDCRVENGNTIPVNTQNIHGHGFQSTLPRIYRIQLVGGGIQLPSGRHIFTRDLSIPRVFNVNENQFGIWYNVPRGTYWLRIWRSSYHPISLCGMGDYQVIVPNNP